jgi:maltose/moltooligosaccharide transporter
VYDRLLGSDPRNLLTVCGACLIVAAFAVLWVREGRVAATNPELAPLG